MCDRSRCTGRTFWAVELAAGCCGHAAAVALRAFRVDPNSRAFVELAPADLAPVLALMSLIIVILAASILLRCSGVIAAICRCSASLVRNAWAAAIELRARIILRWVAERVSMLPISVCVNRLTVTCLPRDITTSRGVGDSLTCGTSQSN